MCSKEDIEWAFQMACRYVENRSLDENALLDLYAWYKQATVGDCNTQKPNVFDFRAKAKWKAWFRLKGISQKNAKWEYVRCLTNIDPDWLSNQQEEAQKSWVVTSSICPEADVPETEKDIFDWVKENKLYKIMEFDKKLLADIHDDDGLTLLHWAADRGHLNIVKYLVSDVGIELNCRDSENQTPLHYAASCGYPSICEYLIERGADKNAKDNSSFTPADVAENSSIKQLLST